LKNIFHILLIVLCGCSSSAGPISAHSTQVIRKTPATRYQGCIERKFMEYNLVDIQTLSPRFFVQLAYSDTSNFINQDIYGKLDKCYLHPETARKLLVADSILQAGYPQYHLLIYDGARPHFVQQLMYDLYRKMPVAQGLYLSHPNNHSLHNYGAAVDLTLCNNQGIPLDMGTEFDHFGAESHIGDEWGLKNNGKISEDAFNNRKLLRKIMLQAKFTPITYEWWHFNSCSRGYAAAHYTLIP
jgi:D-alanyl-D-alanine dipeptidase